MPSNTDYIMQGFQGLSALPGAVAQTKQYDATYGQATDEENQIFEMRKRFVAQGGDPTVFERILKGEDPSALADETYARRAPPGGRPAAGPAPQPMQQPAAPAPVGGGLGAAVTPGWEGGRNVSVPVPREHFAPEQPTPYEPSGMVDLARGNRMGGGLSDTRPAMGEPRPQEPRTRDSIARMSSMLNDVESSRLRQSQAIRNTMPRPSRIDPNDPEVLRMKADLKMEVDQAKEDAYVGGRLAATLASKEKLAELSRALAEAKLGLDEKQWAEKLEYWKSLLAKRDVWEQIKSEGRGDDRALRLILGLINAEAKAVAAPPFQKEAVQDIRNRIPPNVKNITEKAGKTLEGQMGSPPAAPPKRDGARGASSVKGPQPKKPDAVDSALDKMGF